MSAEGQGEIAVARSRWLAALRAAGSVLWKADPLTLSASIAFYTSLSFAPIVVLALAAIAALSPGEERALVDQITRLFGAQVGGATQIVVENAQTPALRWSIGGLIATGALLVSATTAFAQLQEALNRVWGIAIEKGNPVRSWLRRRLFSLGILAAIGFLLVTALVVSTLLALVLTRQGSGWVIANEIMTLAVLALSFACLYRFVPDQVPPWRGALLGGFVTALLFELGKSALGAYLGSTTTGDAYGGASALVLMLLWVYYSALIVLVGAGATHALSLRFGWVLAGRHERG